MLQIRHPALCLNVLVTLSAVWTHPMAAICARGDLDAAHPVPKVRMRHFCVTCCSKRMRPAGACACRDILLHVSQRMQCLC